MNPILFLSLVIILSAALPWWPYSAYGRLRHHRPWDWLLDTPSSEDKLSFWHAYETKIFDQRREEASQKAAMKLGDTQDYEMLRRQLKDVWNRSNDKHPLGLTV